jgi:iduronate 2-sulfatase
MWCKHSNYEQATRIPLIVRAPGKKPSEVAGLVETVDIYPTLVELASLPSVEGLDGRSFATAIAQPTQALRDHITHVFPRGEILGRAIRTERYRLVQWKRIGAEESSAAWELFDYQVDPLEKENLYPNAAPDLVEMLKQKLSSHPAPLRQIK